MRRLSPLLVTFLLACSDGTGPGGVDFDDVNGSWVFTVTEQSGQDCFGVEGDFYATLDFSGNENVGNTVSNWTNQQSDPDRYTLIGNIQTADGETELRFWHTVLEAGFIVLGTMSDDGTFEGTARDPIPGYDGYLSIGGCLYDVEGERLSPAS